MVRDSISLMMANNDEKRNGSTGFYLPRYGNGSISLQGSHIDISGLEQNDSFDLGEIPLHLMKEYKSVYSD